MNLSDIDLTALTFRPAAVMEDIHDAAREAIIGELAGLAAYDMGNELAEAAHVALAAAQEVLPERPACRRIAHRRFWAALRRRAAGSGHDLPPGAAAGRRGTRSHRAHQPRR